MNRIGWARIKRTAALIAGAELLTAGLLFAQSPRQPKPGSATGAKAFAEPGVILRLTFTESSPLNTLDGLRERLGSYAPTALKADSDASQWIPDVSKEFFTAFIPPDRNSSVPYGLLVWVGVGDLATEWQEVFVRHKLIAITIGTSEGPSHLKGLGCYTLPVDAVFNMRKRYPIDERRTYVSGFSAGGQLAAMLVRLYPEVYSGGLFLMGGHFTYVTNHGNEDGPWEATVRTAEPAWRGDYNQRRREVKLVIMRGGADRFWLAQEGRSDAQALFLDGFERVTYIEVPAWPHYPPRKPWFEKGIAALEAKPKKPPSTQPTTNPHPNPAQVAQAHRLLVTAQSELEEPTRLPPAVRKRLEQRERYESMVDRSRRNARLILQQALDEYPTTPTAGQARKLLIDIDRAIAASQPTSQPARVSRRPTTK